MARRRAHEEYGGLREPAREHWRTRKGRFDLFPRTLWSGRGRVAYATSSWGPAAATSGPATSSYFSKWSWKRPTSFWAVSS